MCLGFTGSLSSQMIYTLQTSSNSHFLSATAEIGTDNYLIQNENIISNPQFKVTKSQILKISANGDLLDSLNFPDNIHLSSSLVPYNGFYYGYGTAAILSGNNNIFSSILVKIDLNLNIVKQVVIDTGINNNILCNRIIVKNDRLYIGNCHINTNLICIYKLDLNLVKKDSVKTSGSILSDIANYGNKIIVCGSGFPQSSPFGYLQVMEMDTNFLVSSRFNLDNLKTINPGCFQTVGIFSPATSLQEISGNKYVVIGYSDVVNSASCSATYQNIASTIKNNNQVLNTEIIGDPLRNNVIVSPMTPGNMEHNFIYTTAITGYNSTNSSPPQTNTTQILVHKIDTMGTLIWAKYFSEPDMYYYPYKVLATSDSAVIVCGMRYNLINPAVNNKCEGFVMKIDKDGNQVFVGIKENSGRFSNIICYPNPAKSQIHLDIPFQYGVEITIYSTLGTEVLKINDYKNLSAIEVSQLNFGVYYYKVQTKTKNYSGKFIKE